MPFKNHFYIWIYPGILNPVTKVGEEKADAEDAHCLRCTFLTPTPSAVSTHPKYSKGEENSAVQLSMKASAQAKCFLGRVLSLCQQKGSRIAEVTHYWAILIVKGEFMLTENEKAGEATK